MSVKFWKLSGSFRKLLGRLPESSGRLVEISGSFKGSSGPDLPASTPVGFPEGGCTEVPRDDTSKAMNPYKNDKGPVGVVAAGDGERLGGVPVRRRERQW